MKIDETTRADELVRAWRTRADAENPAGPLFAFGDYAEADIVVATWPISGKCGTGCSASYTRHCC
ncbi:MAG TPA: DUF6229 family protein [Candidatus Limnocylindrales bacterium]